MPKIRAATVAEHRHMVQEALLDAFDALLAVTPYDDITLGAVASRAGVSRNTLYQYADDKSGLLADAAARAGRQLLDRAAAIAENGSRSPAERLAAIEEATVLTFVQGAPRTMLVAEGVGPVRRGPERGPSTPFDELRSVIADVIAEGVGSGDFVLDADLPTTVALLTGITKEALLLILDDAAAPMDAARAATAMVLRALAAPSGIKPA